MGKLEACFFSREGLVHISKQQYSLQDVRILNDYGFETKIVSSFFRIPWNCDLYFSWWASGSILPLIVAKLRSKPILVVAGGNEVIKHVDSLYGMRGGFASASILNKIATTLTLKYATEVFVVSTHMLDHVKRISGREAVVLYNTVDTDKYTPICTSRNCITTVINYDEISFKNKRGILLLDAFQKFSKYNPNIDLQFIGKYSEYVLFLRSYAASIGILNKVRFVFDVPNELMPEYLNRSYLYVQLSDTETFGMSVVEAMSLQIPILCSSKGAFPEIVGDLAFYVNHNDVDEIFFALLRIFEMSDVLYQEIGFKLRQRVIEYFEYNVRKEILFKYFEKYIL
jgi:glycosyltransferase involved in cell wall biosynthesis